jgi:hypothetical protein
MKDILLKVFGNAGGSVAEKISNIIDKHTYNKEEKAEFEKEMSQIFIQAEQSMQKNVTDRWLSDNQGSWLSQNVRPITLLFSISSTVLLIFVDSGSLKFEVSSEWVELLKLLLMTCVASYFGGRSFEKIKNR